MQSQFPHYKDSTPDLIYINENLPERDIPIQCKGDCIHELSSIRDQGE